MFRTVPVNRLQLIILVLLTLSWFVKEPLVFARLPVSRVLQNDGRPRVGVQPSFQSRASVHRPRPPRPLGVGKVGGLCCQSKPGSLLYAACPIQSRNTCVRSGIRDDYYRHFGGMMIDPTEAPDNSAELLMLRIREELIKFPRITTTLLYTITFYKSLVEELEVMHEVSPTTPDNKEFLDHADSLFPSSEIPISYFHSQNERNALRNGIRTQIDTNPESFDNYPFPATHAVSDCLYRKSADLVQALEGLIARESGLSDDLRTILTFLTKQERKLLDQLEQKQLIHRTSEILEETDPICLLPIRPQFSLSGIDHFLKQYELSGGNFDTGDSTILNGLLRTAWALLEPKSEIHDTVQENPSNLTYADPDYFKDGYSDREDPYIPADNVHGFSRDPATGESSFTKPYVKLAKEELKGISKDIFFLEFLHHTLIEEALPPHLSQPWKWYEHFTGLDPKDGVRVFQSAVSPSLHRTLRDSLRVYLTSQLKRELPVGYKNPASCLLYETSRIASYVQYKISNSKYLKPTDRESINRFLRFVQEDLDQLQEAAIMGKVQDRHTAKTCIRAIINFFGSKVRRV